MKKILFGSVLVLVALAILMAGTALAAGRDAADADTILPGQDYFTLVGTIKDFSSTEYGTITVLLHNGNRYVKPVEEGDTQTVSTSPDTDYCGPGLVVGETVSIHGSVVTVSEVTTFVAERVTVGVPCPACP